MGMWCRGLTCDPVKVETAGSNPVIPATEPPMYTHRWFSFLVLLPRRSSGLLRAVCRASYPVFGAPQTHLPNQSAGPRVDLAQITRCGARGKACVEPCRCPAIPFSRNNPHTCVACIPEVLPPHRTGGGVGRMERVLRQTQDLGALVPSLRPVG